MIFKMAERICQHRIKLSIVGSREMVLAKEFLEILKIEKCETSGHSVCRWLNGTEKKTTGVGAGEKVKSGSD